MPKLGFLGFEPGIAKAITAWQAKIGELNLTSDASDLTQQTYALRNALGGKI